VRALSRGLKLLMELNRLGRASPGELSMATAIDRTTVYRMLNTLRSEGFINVDSGGQYVLTLAVRQLSDGFTDLDWISGIVSRELHRMLPKVVWPSDFATFEAGAMVIRESTHQFSPFSIHRSMVGKSRPLLRTALGRAVLANVSEAEREVMLAMLRKKVGSNAADGDDLKYVQRIISATRRRGYAFSEGLMEPHISAIALPVFGRYHRPVGSINLIFFKSAMTIEHAAEKYLAIMKDCVGTIEAELKALDL